MPNRIIRESARTSLTLDSVSAEEERLFWRLVVTVDDHGRFHADPGLVLAACFPLRIGKLRPPLVMKWLEGLVRAGAIRLYSVDGRAYGYFPTWIRHQRRPQSRSKFPAPPADYGATTLPPPRVHGDGAVTAPSLREVVNRETGMTVATPSTDGPTLTPEEAKARIDQFIGKTAQNRSMP